MKYFIIFIIINILLLLNVIIKSQITIGDNEQCICGDCECDNGTFEYNYGVLSTQCTCFPCPTGTYRVKDNDSGTFKYDLCQVVGSPEYYVEPGNENQLPIKRLENECTYFDITKITELANYASNDVYVIDQYGATAALSNILTELQNGKFIEGGLGILRNGITTCAQIELLTPNKVNITGTSPGTSRETIKVINTGGMAANVFFRNLPNWVQIRDPSLLAVVTDGIVEPNVAYELELLINNAQIPPEKFKDGIATYDIIAAGTNFWVQAPEGSPEPKLAETTIKVFSQIISENIIVSPTEIYNEIVVGKNSSSGFQIFNTRETNTSWYAEIYYYDDVGDWLELSHYEGIIEPLCGAESTEDFTEYVDIHINGVNLTEVAYYSAIIIVNADGHEVAIVVDIEAEADAVTTSTTWWDWIEGSGFDSEAGSINVNQQWGVWIVPRDQYGNNAEDFKSDELVEGEYEYYTYYPEIENPKYRIRWWIIPPSACPSEFECEGWETVYNEGAGFNSYFLVPTNGTYGMQIWYDNETFVENRIDNWQVTDIVVNPVDCASFDENSVPDKTGARCECIPGYGEVKKVGFQVTCGKCEVGRYYNEKQKRCSPCESGTYQNLEGQTYCLTCTGREQPTEDQSNCEACADDEIVDTETNSCLACDSTKVVEDDHNCICKPSTMIDGDSCATCPEGALCAYRTKEELLPLEGYWSLPWEPTSFIKCRGNIACPGVKINDTELSDNDVLAAAIDEYFAQLNKTLETSGFSSDTLAQCNEIQLCNTGFTGPLCLNCEIGYTRIGSNECNQCLESNFMVGFLVVGLLFAFLFTVYTIRRTILNAQVAEVIIIKILVSHMQMIAMMSNYTFEWSGLLLTIFNFFDFLSSLAQTLISVECLAGDEYKTTTCPLNDATLNQTSVLETGVFDEERIQSFYIQSIILALLPAIWFIGTGVFWIGLYLKWKYGRGVNKGQSFFAFFCVSNIVFTFFLYPTLSKAGLKFFACSSEVFGDIRFLEADFNIVCFGVSHLSWALTLGLAMLAIYAIGIPLFTIVVLKTHVENEINEKPLDEAEMKKRKRYKHVFGFVFEGYKHEYYYWECVIMMRKLSFAIIAVNFNPIGSDVQGYMGLLVLLVSIILQVNYQPFEKVEYNRAEFGGLLATILTIFCGLLRSSENVINNSQAVQGLEIIVIVLNVSFILYCFKQLYHFAKSIAEDKSLVTVLREYAGSTLGQFAAFGSFRIQQESKSNNGGSNAEDGAILAVADGYKTTESDGKSMRFEVSPVQ